MVIVKSYCSFATIYSVTGMFILTQSPVGSLLFPILNSVRLILASPRAIAWLPFMVISAVVVMVFVIPFIVSSPVITYLPFPMFFIRLL